MQLRMNFFTTHLVPLQRCGGSTFLNTITGTPTLVAECEVAFQRVPKSIGILWGMSQQYAGLELCQLICKKLHHLESLATVASLIHAQQNHFAEQELLFHTATLYSKYEWVDCQKQLP